MRFVSAFSSYFKYSAGLIMSTILSSTDVDCSLSELRRTVKRDKAQTEQLLSKSQELSQICASFQKQLSQAKNVLEDVNSALVHTRTSCPYPSYMYV